MFANAPGNLCATYAWACVKTGYPLMVHRHAYPLHLPRNGFPQCQSQVVMYPLRTKTMYIRKWMCIYIYMYMYSL